MMAFHVQVIHDNWLYGDLNLTIRELKRTAGPGEWVVTAEPVAEAGIALDCESVADLKFALELGGRPEINPWIIHGDYCDMVVVTGFRNEDDCYTLISEIERWITVPTSENEGQ